MLSVNFDPSNCHVSQRVKTHFLKCALNEDPNQLAHACECAAESSLGAYVRRYIFLTLRLVLIILGPVVQSVVSLTSSLRVISLTVLADSIYNILIFFAEKM